MTAAATWGIQIPGGYFYEPTHTYRNEEGVPVVSSTQVYDILGMSDFNNINPAVLDWKRMYGTGLHKGVEFLVHRDLDWETVDDVLIPALTGMESFLKRVEFELEAAEEMRVHTLFGMQYGMTLDLRGKITHQGKRRSAVIDCKTGTKFSPTWFWQLGSYIFPQPKVEGGWMGIVAQIDLEGTVTPHYVPDVEKAKREFQILLAAANLKINAGMARIGKAA